MKVVKIDEELKTVMVSYTMDEFEKEVSRASVLMNLYREYKTLRGEKPSGQYALDFDNDNLQTTRGGKVTTVTEGDDGCVDLTIVQEVLSKEEQKKRRKEEKRKRDEELGRIDPRYGFKTEGLRIIDLLSNKWGKQMVDVDSDEFLIFRIKNKIKDIGYITVILKKLNDRGFCELYFKGATRPQISQFKLKF
jgi:hypothetical protein